MQEKLNERGNNTITNCHYQRTTPNKLSKTRLEKKVNKFDMYLTLVQQNRAPAAPLQVIKRTVPLFKGIFCCNSNTANRDKPFFSLDCGGCL